MLSVAASGRAPFAKKSSAADFRQPMAAPRKGGPKVDRYAGIQASGDPISTSPAATARVLNCCVAPVVSTYFPAISSVNPQPPRSAAMLNRHDRQFEPLPDGRAAAWGFCLLSVIVMLMTSVASGVEQGANSDTGWAIAVPRDAGGQAALDLQQRMILDTVFPAHAPLLTKPALPPPKQAPAAASDMKRVAVRPDGVDGWRPASVPVPPHEDRGQVNPLGPSDSPDRVVLPHEQPIAPAPLPNLPTKAVEQERTLQDHQ